MSEEKILTQEGFDKLQEEYDNLTTVRRKEYAEHLKEARSYGDLSENAEYDAAKDEQAAVEMRIAELEEILRGAKVVDEKKRKKNRIDVGTEITVEYTNLHGKKVKKDFKIVGSAESDPIEGKLSNESPVGFALMGAKEGQTVDVQLPERIVKYKVLKIKK